MVGPQNRCIAILSGFLLSDTMDMDLDFSVGGSGPV